MLRLLLPIILVLFSAQVRSQTTTTNTDEPCLLATDKETWAALGLTAEQSEQVLGIQTTCKTDCAAVSETGERDPKTAAAVLEQNQERLRKVLTEQQYTQWLKWCEERTSRGQLK